MQAVIVTGGKQYSVKEGDIIFVEKLAVEEGSTYTFEKVLAIGGEDGFVVEKMDGSFFIFYNDEKGYGRINNTIMHEIGHIILEHTEDSELADKEVKFFAKYALAPPVLIDKLALKDVFSIANVFDISHEAAGYALSYYRKWLQYGDENYTSYELKTLELFKEAV